MLKRYRTEFISTDFEYKTRMIEDEDGDFVRYEDHVLEVLDYQQSLDKAKEGTERLKRDILEILRFAE